MDKIETVEENKFPRELLSNYSLWIINIHHHSEPRLTKKTRKWSELIIVVSS